MALIGSIDPYVPGSSFTNYVEMVEHFFSSNNIEPNRKKDIFITLAGITVFEEIKLLYPATDLKTLSYEDITKKLKERYDKVDSTIVLRYKFRCRKQGPSETGENFVLAIKLLAESCEFGTHRDDAIRDQLVFGVYDRELQKRLLNEENLTARNAERLIKNSEITVSQARAINSEVSVNSVKHRLGHRDGRRDRYRGRERSRSNDYRGGRRTYNERSRSGDRSVSRGRYANFTCHFCKMKGHIQKNCYRYKNSQKNTVKFVEDNNAKTERVHEYFKRLNVDYSSGSDDSGEYPCLMVASINSVSEPCLLEASIEGKRVSMEVDSGSAVSVMSKKEFMSCFSHIALRNCRKKLIVINGSNLEVFGKVYVTVSVNGKTAKVELIILDGKHNFISLIGRDWLDVFCAGWRNKFSSFVSINNAVVQDNKEKIVSDIKTTYSNLFKRDFSKPIVGFEADLVLRENTPIFKKAYEVPYRLKEKVLDHLDMLEKDGIITPVKTSLWASPVVVVIKKDNDIRLVIDCKVSINRVLIPNTYPLPTAQDLFASIAGCKVYCALDLTTAYTQLNLSETSRQFVIMNTN